LEAFRGLDHLFTKEQMARCAVSLKNCRVQAGDILTSDLKDFGTQNCVKSISEVQLQEETRRFGYDDTAEGVYNGFCSTWSCET
jgi:hypothetical protein